MHICITVLPQNRGVGQDLVELGAVQIQDTMVLTTVFQ